MISRDIVILFLFLFLSLLLFLSKNILRWSKRDDATRLFTGRVEIILGWYERNMELNNSCVYERTFSQHIRGINVAC